MVRPTSIIRLAESSTVRAHVQGQGQRARKQPLSFAVNKATENEERAKCILLHDIPRTALPSDIQKALIDVGAVDSNFSLSSITSLPPSLPKVPTLYRTVHLSFPSTKKAFFASYKLSEHPIFSTTSSHNNSFQKSSNQSQTQSQTQTQTQSQSQFPIQSHFKSQAQLTHTTSTAWTTEIIRKTIEDRTPYEKNRDKDIGKSFTPEWASKAGMSGRRVVIKGLPGSIKSEDVRRLGKECGVLDDEEGCMKLPSSRQSPVTTFCLTTNTVTEAHRLARKIHMKWYKVDIHGQKYLMRAHVHY
ncbi:uncharacterized protein IL334_006278 [Kwoniella shivajii]|uniref:RRM domain-containing protein n=1 Tax=Kwoniella shivajii TaxID=564305 RepID=A0ABZ1D5H8_9TREE|nr:hypothetical protein IL334_006278 [Kwoniella shivajii]